MSYPSTMQDSLNRLVAGREKRMNRRRNRLCCGAGIVGEHGEHLLDEQRVALGRANDAARVAGATR